MKVLLIFGTRPEAIKMSPLILLLRKTIEVKVCVTGQHRQMLDQVLELFKIVPDFDLNLMKSNQNLANLTAEIINGVSNIFQNEKFDWVFVQGDTTSSMAATMTAFYHNIPVGHVEAGLRTYDFNSPFPEEFNRQIISKIAQLHFAPTDANKQNLLKEGFSEKNITITGNTGIDALKWALKHTSKTTLELPINLEKSKMILVTGHRRENFGNRFEKICEALSKIALEKPNIEIVYPVHFNPNVRDPVTRNLSKIPNIHLLEPLEYTQFVHLMNLSTIILTDSGGIQEEAPSLGKPVLVMRDTTERKEAIKAGTVKLVGTDIQTIVRETFLLLDNTEAYKKMSIANNPYGNGTASEKIMVALLNYQGKHV